MIITININTVSSGICCKLRRSYLFEKGRVVLEKILVLSHFYSFTFLSVWSLASCTYRNTHGLEPFRAKADITRIKASFAADRLLSRWLYCHSSVSCVVRDARARASFAGPCCNPHTGPYAYGASFDAAYSRDPLAWRKGKKKFEIYCVS